MLSFCHFLNGELTGKEIFQCPFYMLQFMVHRGIGILQISLILYVPTGIVATESVSCVCVCVCVCVCERERERE